MRRLVHHALAASCVSALIAGAVVGSLTSTALPAESVAVAAPLVSPTGPVLGSSAPTVDAIALDRRLVRQSQVTQRAQLLTATAAHLREQALLEQQNARVEEQHKLQQRVTEQALRRAKQAKRAQQQAQRRAELAKQEATAARRHDKSGQGSGDTGGSPQAIARRIMSSDYGWGSSQFSCYNNIIVRESGWSVHADNPGSSAYGIPQALPGSKMASAGPDWRNNAATQIKWGLGYVKSRYGTPCGAWGFKSSHGWY